VKVWQIIAFLLLSLVLIGATGCPGGGGEISQQLVEVVTGDLIVSVSGSGNIDTANKANLTFGSGGRIAKIYVDEGDEVSKGDVLARLDRGLLELALAQAQAALDSAEYAWEQAKEPYSRDDIESARAAVESAEDYLEYAQWKLRTTLDDDEEYWETEESRAWAALLAAEATLDTILSAPDEDALAAAESQLDAAEQALDEAQKQLDEATITAPFDGVIASVNADEEDNILYATTVIIRLIDLTTMELEAEVDEIDITEVKAGQRAIIEIDALPDLELEGEVISISLLPEEEAGVVVYKVKISFNNPSDLTLRVGMSATADIIIDERSGVLLVPSRAIKQDSQGNDMVKVMANDEVKERAVVTGISDGFDTEILGGLNEREVVVVEVRTR